MSWRRILGLWGASWLALVPGALWAWSGYGLSVWRQLLAAVTFALPLSCASAVAAIVALFVRRRRPDQGRGLSAWLAIATTFWVTLTVFPNHRLRMAGVALGSEEARGPAILAGVSAVAAIIGIVNGFFYFSEPRQGVRRASVSVSAAIGFVAAIAAAVLLADGGDASMPLFIPVAAALGLLAGQALLLMLLVGFAAVRWVRDGLSADHQLGAKAAAPGENS